MTASYRPRTKFAVAALLMAALIAPTLFSAPSADAAPTEVFSADGTVPELRSEFDLPDDAVFTFDLQGVTDQATFSLDYFSNNEPNCDDPNVSNGCFGKKLEMRMLSPDGQVYDVTQRVSPSYTWQDIPDGSLGWTVDDPAQGVWTMYVNADGFYIWYDIDFTVSITADFYTCRGEIATVVLGTGSATPTEGDDVILGTAAADTIDALGGNDVICGLGGDDDIIGGPGDDTIYGDDGNDKLVGKQGADEMHGGAGNDTLHGNKGNDLLYGDAGHDRIFGYANNDTIYGGTGNDKLHGNFGNDVIYGGVGNDRIFGYGDDDRILAGAGDDLVSGNFGDDEIFGEDGNDVLFGADGTDTVRGGPGHDELHGNSGSDSLFGEDGDDTMDGGINQDLCNGSTGLDTAVRCEAVTAVP